MNFFTEIENGSVLVSSKGALQQLPLYHMDNKLYALRGKSFIALKPNYTTSLTSVRWVKIDTGGLQTKDTIFHIELTGPVAMAAE